MILEHYSARPLKWPPRNFRQTTNKPGWGYPPKPEGLWISVPEGDPDWPEWCKGEGFRLEHLAVCSRVILTPEANLKIIKGEAELIAFHEEYGFDYDYGGASFTSGRIDWTKLAKRYDGVVIAPYVWSCRLPMDRDGIRRRISDWYYGWDCASGVIWNGKRAIAAFEITENLQEEAA